MYNLCETKLRSRSQHYIYLDHFEITKLHYLFEILLEIPKFSRAKQRSFSVYDNFEYVYYTI